LGEHVDLLTGFPFKSRFFTHSLEDIPLVKGENVHQGFIDWERAKRWPREQSEEYAKYRLRVGDVILAMDRPWIEAGLKFGWIKKEDPECLLVQRVARMRGNPSLLTDYLRYLIGSQTFADYVRPIVTGVNVPHISGQQIKNFRFRLPPLEIQRKAVAILSAYDNLIDNNNRRIKALEEIIRTIFSESFIKFRSLKSSTKGQEPVSKGQNPQDWNMVRVGDVAEIFRGRSYRTQNLVQEGGLPFVNLKCMNRGGGFRVDGLKRYQGEYRGDQLVTRGEIVIAVTDITQERRLVAHAARVPDFGESPCVFSMDLVKVVPRKGTFPTFLYGMFRYSGFAEEVRQYANGANVLHLNPNSIANYKFRLPPSDVQEQYHELVDPVFQECDNLSKATDVLSQTRDSLLPKLISGELDVGDLDINLESDKT